MPNYTNILILKLQELQQRKGKANLLYEQIELLSKQLGSLKRTAKLTEQAQIIIQNVAQITQKELQYKISEIVSLALASVFNEPYTFEAEFVIRRGKTECDLWFIKNNERVHPLSASGGGVVDVASFALRVALWSISQPRTRNTLLLDEPFKHLSSNLQSRAAEMLHSLSKELGLQIIMISHVEDLIESADAVFKTTIRNGVTRCTRI